MKNPQFAVRRTRLERTPARTGLSIGTSSILVIFVLLCLVTFAVLSLVSANADSRLNEKNTAHVQAYYAAEDTAYTDLAALDKALNELYVQKGDGYAAALAAQSELAGWTLSSDGTALSAALSVPVSDVQTLTVELALPAKRTSAGALYTITAWRLATAGEWQPDDALPVYGAQDESGAGGAALPDLGG